MSLRRRLDSLDARYAATGPLGLVREVPQLAGLLIAVLFLVGTGVVLARAGEQPSGGISRPALRAPSDLILGPAIGEPVAAYSREARAGLARALASSQTSARVALVTLSEAVSIARATELVAGLQVNRVYLRVAAAGRPETVAVPVRDLARDLPGAAATLVADKARQARARRRLADSLEGPRLASDRAVVEGDVRVLERARAGYARRCACVIALVVTAPPALLVELAATQDVVAVQVRADRPPRVSRCSAFARAQFTPAGLPSGCAGSGDRGRGTAGGRGGAGSAARGDGRRCGLRRRPGPGKGPGHPLRRPGAGPRPAGHPR